MRRSKLWLETECKELTPEQDVCCVTCDDMQKAAAMRCSRWPLLANGATEQGVTALLTQWAVTVARGTAIAQPVAVGAAASSGATA